MSAFSDPWTWVFIAWVFVPGVIGAWLSLRLALPLFMRAWCAWRRRAARPVYVGALDEAPVDAPVTLEGRLVLGEDGPSRVVLEVHGGRVEIDDPVSAWIGGETVVGDDWVRRARDGDRVIARGRLRVTADEHGAEAYRGTSRRRALSPDGAHVRLTVLAARGAPRWRLVALAFGALACPTALDDTLRRAEGPLFAEVNQPSGWRVRSARYPRVVLEPVFHEDVGLECALLKLSPRTHDDAMGFCSPWTLEILGSTRSPRTEKALRWVDEHTDVRTRVTVSAALGQVSTATTIAKQSSDPAVLARAARWAFATGDLMTTHELLDLLARRAPLGELQGAWAYARALALPSYERAHNRESDPAAFGQLPEDAREVVRCLLDARSDAQHRERFGYAFRDGAVSPDRVRSMVESPYAGCRILGATWLSQRDDHALAALAEAARTAEPEWLSWIDATRDVIALEGIMNGRARVPPPREADAFGDLDAAHLEGVPGFAHLLELASYGPQRRGYHWLVERARLPALDALAMAHAHTYGTVTIRGFGLEPPYATDDVGWYTHSSDASWLRWTADGYRMALASIDDARTRDARFDDRWRARLLRGEERVTTAAEWTNLWNQIDRPWNTMLPPAPPHDESDEPTVRAIQRYLDTGVWAAPPDAATPFHDGRMARLVGAVRSGRPGALTEALGAPTEDALTLAHAVLPRVQPEVAEELAPWAYEAILDESSVRQTAFARRRVFMHASAVLRRATYGFEMPGYYLPFSHLDYEDPFVAAVAETLRLSLASRAGR